MTGQALADRPRHKLIGGALATFAAWGLSIAAAKYGETVPPGIEAAMGILLTTWLIRCARRKEQG